VKTVALTAMPNPAAAVKPGLFASIRRPPSLIRLRSAVIGGTEGAKANPKEARFTLEYSGGFAQVYDSARALARFNSALM
jgi:hypothetical protein